VPLASPSSCVATRGGDIATAAAATAAASTAAVDRKVLTALRRAFPMAIAAALNLAALKNSADSDAARERNASIHARAAA
jgi:hypothetical protein